MMMHPLDALADEALAALQQLSMLHRDQLIEATMGMCSSIGATFQGQQHQRVLCLTS